MKSSHSGKQGGKSSNTDQLSSAERVYDRLHLEILTFGLIPGETFSEASLAARFDFPIAAVRAALSRLRQDGLMINRKRLGHMVRPVTFEDIHNTYEMRGLLEPVAVEKAMKNLDPEVLHKLELELNKAIQKSDRKSQVKALFVHREFHLTIAQASGNQQLEKWIRELSDHVLRFQYLDIRNSEISGQGWQDQHKDIIAAIEQGNARKAAEAMKEDIMGGHELVIQAILNLPEFRKLNLGGSSTDAGNGSESLVN